jgi:hypothetical protein
MPTTQSTSFQTMQCTVISQSPFTSTRLAKLPLPATTIPTTLRSALCYTSNAHARKQDPPQSTIPNMSDATERARQSAHTVAASSPEVPEEACPDTPQATTPSINAATERTHKPDPKRMITFTEQESGLRVSPSDLELEMPTDLDTKPAFYLAL